jgi:hypothetical protein
MNVQPRVFRRSGETSPSGASAGAGSVIQKRCSAAIVCALLLLAPGLGCRTARPLDADENPAAKGTLNGTVRGVDNGAPVAGRQVEAVRISDGRRFTAKTNAAGGFTFLVPPGRYRLDLSLARAEKIVSRPDIIDVSSGSFIGDADFVMGGAGSPSE